MPSLRLVLAIAGVLALAAHAGAAPPVAGQVQPDRLPLGTLHVGGIAEASFLVFAPVADPKPEVKVEAPKFVKVLNTGTHDQQFGAGNNYTCVTVEVAIDTARAGDLDGTIKVTFGETVTTVPVTATVKAKKVGQPRVLIVGTPFKRYSTNDAKMYKGWTDLVRDSGMDATYLLVREKKPVLRDLDLSKFNCVLLSANALIRQDAEDVKRARAYAEGGGRVVVTANEFFVGSVKGANEVLDGSGLELLDQEAPAVRGQKDTVLKKDDFAADVVKAGVASATFFRASPVRVEKGGRVLVNAVGFGKPGLGFAATAKVGKGEVTALGVSLWCFWVSEERAAGSDNAKLLGWLLVPPLPG